ncbi:SDR family oxidoreductase [Amycolatopsis rhizosphaerae]|uniref:SDR family oxidoreductase n=1 Tax=Amycolatopsis rhizosphaerae TaxID=2053003 RepID=A0A558DIW6_9PSEU|nr:SDR family oxidoreductase [Amycolatopsis rhizosphaerae]TVT60947.1 SDR family oxidoreductase [Amycolatopsis rhizosphaerae]
MNFTGKTVLVTGSGSVGGLGHVTAGLIAARGGNLVLTGRDAGAGESALREIVDAGGEARFVEADLTTLDGVRALVHEVKAVDILINNAGLVPFGPAETQDEDVYEAVFGVNVRAAFFLTTGFVAAMRARGGGSVVNISSMAATRGLPDLAVYGATKAALESLTRSWAAEWAPAGIRVNAVAPGPMTTAKTVAALGPEVGGMGKTTALGRVSDPTEVAEVIAFVASDQASYLTGAVVAVDGGRTAI